jgi:LPS sulfotransferase NodH
LSPTGSREPVRVFYDEFVDTRAVTIGRVLDALGINPREPDGKKGPMLQQADNVSQDWVARFRRDDADQPLTS